jgi:hypothetical protein
MPVKRRVAPTPKFWWFSGQSVVRLVEKLNTTPNAGVKVVLKNDKMTFEVIDSVTKVGHDPINDSHVCPGSPGCP